MGRYTSKEQVEIEIARYIIELRGDGIEPKTSGVKSTNGRFTGYISFADGTRCTLEVVNGTRRITPGRTSLRPSKPIEHGFNTPAFFTASERHTSIRTGEDQIGQFLNSGMGRGKQSKVR